MGEGIIQLRYARSVAQNLLRRVLFVCYNNILTKSIEKHEYKWLLDKLNSKRLYGGFKPRVLYIQRQPINEKFRRGRATLFELMQEYITLNDLLLH